MSLMSGKTTEKNPRSDRNGKRSQNKRDENAGSKKSKIMKRLHMTVESS